MMSEEGKVGATLIISILALMAVLFVAYQANL